MSEENRPEEDSEKFDQPDSSSEEKESDQSQELTPIPTLSTKDEERLYDNLVKTITSGLSKKAKAELIRRAKAADVTSSMYLIENSTRFIADTPMKQVHIDDTPEWQSPTADPAFPDTPSLDADITTGPNPLDEIAVETSTNEPKLSQLSTEQTESMAVADTLTMPLIESEGDGFEEEPRQEREIRLNAILSIQKHEVLAAGAEAAGTTVEDFILQLLDEYVASHRAQNDLGHNHTEETTSAPVTDAPPLPIDELLDMAEAWMESIKAKEEPETAKSDFYKLDEILGYHFSDSDLAELTKRAQAADKSLTQLIVKDVVQAYLRMSAGKHEESNSVQEELQADNDQLRAELRRLQNQIQNQADTQEL